MRIDDFENHVNPRIVDRGRDYFSDGHVGNLRLDGETFSALVRGTEDYHVSAEVTGEGEILSLDCDCPYDLGPFCKHELALLFAIRETWPNRMERQEPSDGESGLGKETSADLSSLSRKQLEGILLKAAERHPEVGDQIVLSLTKGKRKLAEAAQMIRFGIDQGSPGGFFEAEDRDEIAGGFDLVMEEAEESEDIEEAVSLILTAIRVCNEAIRSIDESEYLLGDLVNEAKDNLTRIVKGAWNEMSASQGSSVFDSILNLVAMDPEEELSGHGGGLFDLLLGFCGEEDRRRRYEALLDEIQKNLPPAGDHPSEWFAIRLWEMKKYHFLSKWKSDEERRAFLKDGMANPDLRSIAIEEAILAKDVAAALVLIDDGIRHDAALPRLVRRWEKYAFSIHAERHDAASVRELAGRFLRDGEFGYYDAYLETFPEENRDAEVDALLAELSENHNGSEIFPKILVAEKRFAALMDYCEADPNRILKFHSHLRDRYPDRVEECFFRWIMEAAKPASSRNQYRDVCERILLYRKICGGDHRRVVGILRELYSRKPAFMDELKRLN